MVKTIKELVECEIKVLDLRLEGSSASVEYYANQLENATTRVSKERYKASIKKSTDDQEFLKLQIEYYKKHLKEVSSV